MKETKEIKKSRNITFRLTDDEYSRIEKAADASGEDPNTLCRKLALTQLSEGVPDLERIGSANGRLFRKEVKNVN